MALETGTYISDLVSTNPVGTDTIDKADDHLRLIKSTVKATFPNISGAVTPTHTELNFVDGVTSAIQTQLDSKSPLASPTFTGTPAAPTAAVDTNTTQLATTAYVVGQGYAKLASPTFTGVVAVQAGAAGTPALIPTGDTNTGIWFPAADTVAVSTAGSERLRIDSGGNVGVNKATPASYGSYTTLSLDGTDTDIDLFRGGVRQFAIFTAAANTTLGTIANVPLKLGANNTYPVTIDTSQNLLQIGTGGIGYGTGSGGTVTQLTNKSTGVTLNKTNGQITMNGAALAANAYVSFTLTNSTISATDNVIVNYASGGTASSYWVRVAEISAGSCIIGVQNVSGGSLSQAVVLTFTVIKGATS